MDGGGIDLKLAREFLIKAKSDMESAEILLKNGKYEDAAYHFQQASEKMSEDITVAIKDLEKHWLITRYPLRSGKEIWSPVEQYTKANAEDALKKAKFVFEKISKILKEKYDVIV